MDKRTKKKVIKIIDSSYIQKYNLPPIYKEKSIVLYEDRYQHFEKHKYEFSSIEAYKKSILNINEIINNPDFISLNDKNNSLEFVKKLDDNTLIAVRISSSKEFKIKTLYPISATKKAKLKEKSFFISG